MKELDLTNKIKLMAGIVFLGIIGLFLLLSLNPLIPLFNLQLTFSFILLVLFSNMISAYVYRFIQKREGAHELV